MLSDACDYDVAVIGGGIVGLATFRALALAGVKRLCLLEAGDIISGASSGNSGIFHTGFDAPPGSLELQLMKDGFRRFAALRRELHLPVERKGAIVVAWTDEELK